MRDKGLKEWGWGESKTYINRALGRALARFQARERERLDAEYPHQRHRVLATLTAALFLLTLLMIGLVSYKLFQN
jgi:hypothetical protein